MNWLDQYLGLVRPMASDDWHGKVIDCLCRIRAGKMGVDVSSW